MIAEKTRKIRVFMKEVLNRGSANSLVKFWKPTKSKLTALEPLRVMFVME